MKLNIAYPPHGTQKLIPVDSDEILASFYDQHLGAEIALDKLGEDWEGYVAKITGGNDKQGFPMMQGVLSADRVKLLLTKNHKCYNPKRKGERKRKSVRGCIVSNELSVLALVIIVKGPGEINGLTDVIKPKLRGPKRASKIRRLFNLDKKKDNVVNYVMRPTKMKKYKGEMKKVMVKVKIQRLVTPAKVRQKRRRKQKKQDRHDRTKELKAIHSNLIQNYMAARRKGSPRKSPRKFRK